MIEITSFRQGAVLNHNHGKESKDALVIKVQGISDSGYPVQVNGIQADMDGQLFSVELPLTKRVNTITASVLTPLGEYTQTKTVLWDKASFRRFHLFIDDHSFLFTDLAKERPQRAFSHFYLKALKDIHDKYGTTFSLNTFYRNDHSPEGFTLDKMPDCYKPEFIDNSDWLRFSFHAYSEFPDRPYAECTAEEFGRDFDLVKNEIIRFAGAESWVNPLVIHWANIHPAAAGELIRRGVHSYCMTYRLRVMGGPSLSSRQNGGDMKSVEQRSISGEDKNAYTYGLEMHYGFSEEDKYMTDHGVRFDPVLGVNFFQAFLCSNLTPLENIRQRCLDSVNRMSAHGTEAFCAGGHEQYSFPYYPNYEPDHLERLELVSKTLVEDLNCKPVFLDQGDFGNMAWY